MKGQTQEEWALLPRHPHLVLKKKNPNLLPSSRKRPRSDHKLPLREDCLQEPRLCLPLEVKRKNPRHLSKKLWTLLLRQSLKRKSRRLSKLDYLLGLIEWLCLEAKKKIQNRLLYAKLLRKSKFRATIKQQLLYQKQSPRKKVIPSLSKRENKEKVSQVKLYHPGPREWLCSVAKKKNQNLLLLGNPHRKMR